MKHLLDINLLIALGHASHDHHSRAIDWFGSMQKANATLCTCAITELGFVRVSVQAGLQADLQSARKALAALKATSTIPFELIGDSIGVDRLPAFAKTPLKLRRNLPMMPWGSMIRRRRSSTKGPSGFSPYWAFSADKPKTGCSIDEAVDANAIL